MLVTSENDSNDIRKPVIGDSITDTAAHLATSQQLMNKTRNVSSILVTHWPDDVLAGVRLEVLLLQQWRRVGGSPRLRRFYRSQPTKVRTPATTWSSSDTVYVDIVYCSDLLSWNYYDILFDILTNFFHLFCRKQLIITQVLAWCWSAISMNPHQALESYAGAWQRFH